MLFGPPPDASWVELLPDGHQGTWRTLEAMRYLVRKDYRSSYVRQKTRRLLLSMPQQGGNPVEALFLFARDRIRFREDPPGVERVADFRRTTEAGYGDCDDKVVWLATALLSLGISARFVVQSYGEQWDHVYLEYFDWSRFSWVALDPSADGHTGIWGPPGWRQSLGPAGYEMRFAI